MSQDHKPNREIHVHVLSEPSLRDASILIRMLERRARQAFDQSRWVLAATLCRALEELQLDDTLYLAGDAIREQMAQAHRGEQVSHAPQVCSQRQPGTVACGQPVRWTVAASPEGPMRGQWVHVDVALDVDHAVELQGEPTAPAR